MSPLSATTTSSPAYARVDAPQASREAASAREVKAVEAANAMAGMKGTSPQAAVASVMDGMSTMAVANALSSIPAALGRMRDIAMAASSGTLTDADRATLQAEYSDLNKQVASVVGSVSANESSATSSDKRQDPGSDAGHDASGSAGHGDTASKGYSSPDRAVRAKTASPVSTVATAHAEAAHDPAKSTARMAALRAATVAQFQHASTPAARGRISLVA